MHAIDGQPKVVALNTELTAADPALVSNDALLAVLLDASEDCIKILDLDGRLQFMSEGGKRVMEVEDFSVLKGCPWPDLWADEGNLAARQAVQDAKQGKAARFLGAANTAKGSPDTGTFACCPFPDRMVSRHISCRSRPTSPKPA